MTCAGARRLVVRGSVIKTKSPGKRTHFGSKINGMHAHEIGFGLGLRPEHYEAIAASPGRVSWFEALSENYMVPGGGPLHWLDHIRRDYPMALHGVSLSIGSIDPLDRNYLDDLKALVGRVQPMWV